MPKRRRLLIVTDNHYVSAVLFHGLGLPPWYDLPEVQRDPTYRKVMAGKVNRLVDQAQEAGFTDFDVHEAFPVHFMDLREEVRIIRGCDRFLPSRKYAGAAFLRQPFKGLQRQPRLRCIRRMALGGKAIDETDLLAMCLGDEAIPIVYSETESKLFVGKSGRGFVENSAASGAKLSRKRKLVIELAGSVPLDKAEYYPGVKLTEAHGMAAQVGSGAQALEIYKYAGLLIQTTGKFKAELYR